MAEYKDDRAADLKREQLRQNMDDLNNDMAGRDTGRIKRFVTAGQSGLQTEEDKKEDADLRAYADLVLQAERQRQAQIERLNKEFARYDKATTLALKEIDEEIALAEKEYKRIQDNATELEDGRRVYRDETNGHFYDEDDQRVSSKDEIEARENYQDSHSSRQQRNTSVDRVESLRREHEDVVKFQEKQNERQQRLKDHPEEADEIEQEIEDAPVPDRVQKIHDRLAAAPSHEIRTEASTSVAKSALDGGIESELALMPAFRDAAAVERAHQQPDIKKDITPTGPGMALG